MYFNQTDSLIFVNICLFWTWCQQHVSDEMRWGQQKTGKDVERSKKNLFGTFQQFHWSQVRVLWLGLRGASSRGSVIHKQGWGEVQHLSNTWLGTLQFISKWQHSVLISDLHSSPLYLDQGCIISTSVSCVIVCLTSRQNKHCTLHITHIKFILITWKMSFSLNHFPAIPFTGNSS